VIPDNIGVQYGLEPLNDGTISVEQFLDLNESVGGINEEGFPIDERSQADPQAIERAFATGRVNRMSGGLASTPIIDLRYYGDAFPGEFHDSYRSWMIRERLLAANGHADNHVMWTTPPGFFVLPPNPIYTAAQAQAVAQMDAWLTALVELEATQPDLEPIDRTRLAQPDDLTDGCWTPTGEFVAEERTYDGDGACNELYPFHGDPRTAAGGPLSGETLKCELKDPDPADYAVEFTADEWDRLVAAFPDGVCDWDAPGVGEVPLEGTWLRF
jgi:hypothetical protein